MIEFTTTLLRFGEQGEKTGWTYIDMPIAVTDALKPGQKTSFRVQGMLDAYPLERVALLPMGDGRFVMPINATMRQHIRKEAGASVRLLVRVDDSPVPLSADLLACLDDEPQALAFFETLSRGHQVYFSQWIERAKTIETKTKRITQAINGLRMGLGYGEMIRYYKQ